MRTIIIDNRIQQEEIIRSCKICYLAMAEGHIPYILPMNFALDGNKVILHSAQEGRKWEILKTNPKICINWTQGESLSWQNEKMACSYTMKSKSVIVEGTAEIVEDYDEKYRLMQVFMKQYSDLEFKFGKPAIRNVGVVLVDIEKISAKEFGATAEIKDLNL